MYFKLKTFFQILAKRKKTRDIFNVWTWCWTIYLLRELDRFWWCCKPPLMPLMFFQKKKTINATDYSSLRTFPKRPRFPQALLLISPFNFDMRTFARFLTRLFKHHSGRSMFSFKRYSRPLSHSWIIISY